METGDSVFGICRSALTEAIGQAIRDHRESLNSSKLEEKRPDYTDPLTQFVFLRTEVPFKSLVISKIIENTLENLHTDHDLANLFEQGGRIDIASIGCGPGSDLLGVIKYYSSSPTKFQPKLGWNLYDETGAWESTFWLVQQRLARVTGVIGDSLNCANFHKWDLTKDNGGKILWKSHLYIFSMVLSDIFRFGDEAELKQVELNLIQGFEEAGSGAYFLFVDTMGPEDSRKMTALMNRIFGDRAQEFYKFFNFQLSETELLEAKAEWGSGGSLFAEKEEPAPKCGGDLFYYLYKKM